MYQTVEITVVDRLQGYNDLPIDLEKKIIGVVGIGLTQTKLAGWYKEPVWTLQAKVRKLWLLSNECVKEKIERNCKLGPPCVRSLLIHLEKNN